MEKKFSWDNSDFSPDDLSPLSRTLFGDLEGFQFDLNLYSMSNYAGLFSRLATVFHPGHIAEIGVFEARFSSYLMQAFAPRCQTFDFIDVAFRDSARDTIARCAGETGARYELFEERSSDYLRRGRAVDWYFIDGDHNYETVREELDAIARPAERRHFVICHDTGWPCARWDGSYDPEALSRPDDFQPGYISPFSSKTVEDYGLEFGHVAAEESGDRSGVLTAVEDFLAASGSYGHLRFTPFFGLSLLWPRGRFSEDENQRIEQFISDPELYADFVNKLELNRLMLLISLQRAGRVWKKQRASINRLRNRLDSRGE